MVCGEAKSCNDIYQGLSKYTTCGLSQLLYSDTGLLIHHTNREMRVIKYILDEKPEKMTARSFVYVCRPYDVTSRSNLHEDVFDTEATLDLPKFEPAGVVTIPPKEANMWPKLEMRLRMLVTSSLEAMDVLAAELLKKDFLHIEHDYSFIKSVDLLPLPRPTLHMSECEIHMENLYRYCAGGLKAMEELMDQNSELTKFVTTNFNKVYSSSKCGVKCEKEKRRIIKDLKAKDEQIGGYLKIFKGVESLSLDI